ncbi:MAG TPA: glycosyltransferase family 2 protein [Pyrinomonadaceae bacterium]|nr:glycosyltransferase family 2 protein [Pyrinomonadaceae bacterium]
MAHAPTMLFSVVIPVYNRAALVGATLDSVLGQEFEGEFEVVVVDDGSTDETPAVLARYGGRVRVLRQENAGPGAARNLGIGSARGEYVAFLDSDDLWFPWTLSTYDEIIRTHARPAFVAGGVTEFSAEARFSPPPKSPLKEVRLEDYYASSSHSWWLQLGAVVVRRDVFLEVGGFTNASINAEDSDLWLKLGTAKGFVHFSSPPVYAYRRHPASAVSNSRKTLEGIQYLISEEKAGRYPGGAARRAERLELLTRHVRPVSLACLERGEFRRAWQLYRATLWWHARLGRARYAAAFPLLACRAAVRHNLKQTRSFEAQTSEVSCHLNHP